jgi:hypothetical protein
MRKIVRILPILLVTLVIVLTIHNEQPDPNNTVPLKLDDRLELSLEIAELKVTSLNLITPTYLSSANWFRFSRNQKASKCLLVGISNTLIPVVGREFSSIFSCCQSVTSLCSTP